MIPVLRFASSARAPRLRGAWLLAALLAAGNAAAVCGDAGTPCAVDNTPGVQKTNAPVNLGVGNPIHLASGNKYQQEVDLPALPGVLGIEIVRHYNSSLSSARHLPGPLGRGWRLSYEVQLAVIGNTIEVTQADGSTVAFGRDLADPSVARHRDPARGTIRIDKRGRDEQYTWTWADGRKLSFDRLGLLTQIQAGTGEILSLQYDAAGLLARVTDPQGRSLRFDWLDKETARAGDRFRGVRSIDTPVGRFAYGYGSAAPKGMPGAPRALLANLVSVRYPEAAGMPNSGRSYHYENGLQPTLLTGISIDGKDAAGKPVSARYATYAYRADGKAIASSHAGGANQVTLDYGVPGQTTVTNSLGQKTVVKYTALGDDWRVLESRGAGCAWCGETNVRYQYDKAGRLVQTTKLDAAGKPLWDERLELDTQGRTVRVARAAYVDGKAQPAQWRARYEYGTGTEPTLVAHPSVIAGRESVTRYVYNAAGQLLSTSDSGWARAPDPQADPVPLSRTTRYTYRTINGRSVLATIDGPLPNGQLGTPADSDITVFNWDSRGSFITGSVAPGHIVTQIKERDAALRAAVVVRNDGVRIMRSSMTRAPQGQTLVQSESAWMVGKKGLPDDTTKAERTVSHRYDAQGRAVALERAEQPLIRYQYDAAGNLTHTVLPDYSQLARTLDTEGRVLAEAQFGPDGGPGRLRTYDYDANGLRRFDSTVTTTNGAGLHEVRSREIDPDSAKHAAGKEYQFGQAGSVAEVWVETVTRPDGSQVTRWFDDFGRVSAVRSPEKGLVTSQYDAAGSMVAMTDARGVTTRIARDASGRALQVDYSATAHAKAASLVFAYSGQALAMESLFRDGKLDNQTRWEADVWGRPSKKTLQIAAGTGAPDTALTLRTAFDERTLKMTQTTPGGASVTFQYNLAGKVTSVTVNGKPLVSGVRHGVHAGGARPVEFTFGNGLRTRTSYDSNGQLAAHDSGVERLAFRINAAQQIEAIDRSPSPTTRNATASSWTLPSLLSSAHAAPAAGHDTPLSQSYRYDALGQLIGERHGSAAQASIDYDLLGNRAGSPAAALDASGNVLTQRDLHLEYNQAGQLVSVRNGAGAVLAEYRYDAGGMRVAKVAGGRTTYFLYENGQLAAEADGNGQVLAEYVYLGQRPVARLRYLPQEGAVAAALRSVWNKDPVVDYLHADHRGAVEAVTDAQGKLIWQGRLDAFGQLITEHGSKGDMPLRLAGQYADAESGLYYNVHRYYDPASGRYLQADPLGLAAGLNMYAYAANDPLLNTDPLGLEIEPDDTFPEWLDNLIFGTAVHIQAATLINARLDGWGANNGRGGTWNPYRPDAYHVDATNRAKEKLGQQFQGRIWELKPVSWSSDFGMENYNRGKAEIAFYQNQAKKGCWTPGSSAQMANSLPQMIVPSRGHAYNVAFEADKHDDKSGLFFYTKERLQEKPAPVPAPAPALARNEQEKMRQVISEVKVEGEREGWSVLKTLGMIVFMAAAIALMIALLPEAAVAAIISGIVLALRAAIAIGRAGGPRLIASIASIFALQPAVVNAAEQKGREKQQGLLDSTIGWFKSWF